MLIYRPPSEVLDDTLRRAFDIDHTLDDQFRTLLDRLRLKDKDGREAT